MAEIEQIFDRMAGATCPIVNGEREPVDGKQDRPIRTRETVTVQGEFDLSTQAMRIFARARGGQRVRSSNII